MVSLKKVTKTLMAGLSLSTYVAMADGLDQLLVEPEQLQGEVERGAIVIDLRELSPENELSILPGAISSPFSGWRGPEQNPGTILSPTRASKLFGSLGLAPDDRIILATAGGNNSTFGAAARATWDLMSFGFNNIAILHGGIAEYQIKELPFADSYRSSSETSLSLEFSDQYYASSSEILARVEGKDTDQLFDARPATWHNGQLWHPASTIPGTIEGSTVLDFSSFFESEDSSRLKSSNDISRLLDTANVGVNNISFCEAGWWSAGNWFLISQVAGIDGAKLYAEGRVDWTLNDLPQVNVPTEEEFEALKAELSKGS